MARTVKRQASAAFLRQAEEFLESARENLASGRPNAAGFNAIQSLINANDAVTAHFLGLCASMDHRESIRLHVDVVRILDDRSQRAALKRCLDLRSEFGYLGKPVSRTNAERVVKAAARFFEWSRRTLPRNGRS